MKVCLRKRAECVTDLLTGEVVAKDADSFEAVFATPDTRLFKIGTGAGDAGTAEAAAR